jgi:polar amino acid transport system ATP-binding protein
MRPDIMLFDEVTASLDPETVREVLDVILDLARQGLTMLIVTHEMAFARAVADRVVLLDGGVIVESGDPEVFFTAPATDRAREFLGAFSFERVRGRGPKTSPGDPAEAPPPDSFDFPAAADSRVLRR